MAEENKQKKEKGTISYIKEKRTVPEEVKEKSKKFAKLKRTIRSALESGPKTIPQIAEITNLPLDVVTYNVMTLQKFGQLEISDVDEDEYYFYELPKKK
jgi:16S rRNA U1498 N3-methylase RsmE